MLAIDHATADLSLELLASLSTVPQDAETLRRDLGVSGARFAFLRRDLVARGYDLHIRRDHLGKVTTLALGLEGQKTAREDAGEYLEAIV